MYQVRYLVSNASGIKKEHSVNVSSFEEYKAVLSQCKKLGHQIVRNSMCDRCNRLGVDCNGELNHVYTGCVYRGVV